MWDKTKAYKSSKLGEKDLTFERTFFFFFTFLFLVSKPLSSYNQLGVIFFFPFLCVRVPYIYKEILGGVRGAPPLAPPLVLQNIYSIFHGQYYTMQTV